MNKHDNVNGQSGINKDTTKGPILATRFLIYVGPRTKGGV